MSSGTISPLVKRLEEAVLAAGPGGSPDDGRRGVGEQRPVDRDRFAVRFHLQLLRQSRKR